ncbi:4003_t:CDS:2 [Funneliformis mosseae]|uniref:4003_t:CDS:1 n=1 Tax=Funneliformis mosseae TaxID=27381 RepID=A0A9N9HGT4_FUNMO|nr:4003_t:CDS:2 [Funneliformis mosseae]
MARSQEIIEPVINLSLTPNVIVEVVLEAFKFMTAKFMSKSTFVNCYNRYSIRTDIRSYSSMPISSSIYHLARYLEMQKKTRIIISVIGDEIRIQQWINLSVRRYPAPMAYRQLQMPTKF